MVDQIENIPLSCDEEDNYDLSHDPLDGIYIYIFYYFGSFEYKDI